MAPRAATLARKTGLQFARPNAFEREVDCALRALWHFTVPGNALSNHNGTLGVACGALTQPPRGFHALAGSGALLLVRIERVFHLGPIGALIEQFPFNCPGHPPVQRTWATRERV